METLTNAEKLRRINEFDARPSHGPLQFVGQTFGPKPWFISFFKRVGPRIDPIMSRVSGGEWMKSVYGLPGLVLHTTGAKSGAARSNQLLYVRDGDDFIVIGTNFGQPKHPAWTANLKAHPDAGVEIGGITLPVRANLIEGDDGDALFARLVKVYPGYALYLDRRGDLPPRMFRLVPGV
jgi:deazaflavin-dependent oxidoreductase (nitroreductase family)